MSVVERLGLVAPLIAASLAGSQPQPAAHARQSPGRDVVEQARALWQMRRTRSAIEILQTVADDPKFDRRADAQLLLGDIYFFRGWEAENAFPGWHEEPDRRAQAVQAFRTAEAARPDWSAPHERLGRVALREERPADALTEFDAALARAPGSPPARVGRWRALIALGRAFDATSEVLNAADASDPEVLGAARQALILLRRQPDADAVAARLVDRFPRSDAAAAVLAERIQTARVAKRYGDVLELAPRYVERYASNAALPDVYDALLEAYQATAPPEATDAREIIAAIEARTRLRADPGPMLVAANLLVARMVRLDKAILLAEESIPAAERFITENAGAYKMAAKARALLGRTRATATDLTGWAYFLERDIPRAEARLLEAERLSHGQDAANQFHLGELARANGNFEGARDHYLSCLTLTGPPQTQAAARESLGGVSARLAGSPADFDAYLSSELARRREARHRDLVTTLIDHLAPSLKLTDVEGRTVDLAALRGKVVLLNFFSSW